jgi:hypothetical protein
MTPTVRWSYTEAKRHVDAIDKMRWHKRRRLCRQAGVDPEYIPHARNAMISYKQGRPWPNVDYSLVRRILWLDSKRCEPYDVLSRYCRKRDQEDRFWIQANQGKFA